MNIRSKMVEDLQKYANIGEGFVGFVVKLPNQDSPELIINSPSAMYNKAIYISRAYDMDLRLLANPEVRIVRYGWYINFEDLEELLNEPQ